MKKVLFILLGIIVVIAAGGFIFLKVYLSSMNQIDLQYKNEVKPEYKRELDYSKFDKEIEGLDAVKMKVVKGIIEADDLEALQQSVKEGSITVEECVIYYLQKIKEHDMNYNTVIQLNPIVIDEARKIDKRIASGEKVGKLFGSVILIKDNVSEKNMNTASGAYALKDLKTKRDSFIVEKLKSEDALILGKANLSEWSNFMSMPSSNGFSVLGGQTKNPYGMFDVGGSSSGSSAAAALNFSTVTVGSETAGSLIYPAGQNSVVAIKPTLGVLSRDLIVPIAEAQDTAGIIGRKVEDVYRFFIAAAGEDKKDPLADNAKVVLSKSVEKLDKEYLSGKRIGIIKEKSERYDKLKKELASAGAEVVDIEIDESRLGIDMMTVLYYGIKHDVKEFLNNEDVISEFKNLEDIYKFNEEDSENRMPFGADLHKQAIEKNISEDEVNKAIENNRASGKMAIDKAMEENEVIAIASFSNELSGIYAPAMCPAITVPAGYKDSGEPYGVTFVSTLNDDIKLFNIAYSYEEETKHRKNPELK